MFLCTDTGCVANSVSARSALCSVLGRVMGGYLCSGVWLSSAVAKAAMVNSNCAAVTTDQCETSSSLDKQLEMSCNENTISHLS